MTVLNNLGRYHLTKVDKLYVREYGDNVLEMKNRARSY